VPIEMRQYKQSAEIHPDIMENIIPTFWVE
jgi:hypothetical protein